MKILIFPDSKYIPPPSYTEEQERSRMGNSKVSVYTYTYCVSIGDKDLSLRHHLCYHYIVILPFNNKSFIDITYKLSLWKEREKGGEQRGVRIYIYILCVDW